MKLFSQLWQKVILGMFVGVIFGYYAGEKALVFKPFATLFINSIKMIIIPTVFFAILYGMSAVCDILVLRSIGTKALFFYIGTTLIAIAIGIVLALLIKPGENVPILSLLNGSESVLNNFQKFNFTERFSNIISSLVPTNPVQSMVSGNIFHTVFFAILMGISIISSGNKVNLVKTGINQITGVIFKLVEIVIRTTPVGVFFLMACLVGEHGFTIIYNLSKLVMTILLALFLQYLIYGVMLFISKLNPLKFYKKTSNIQALALATSSSKATISTSINDLQKKLGVSENIAKFVLPLGAAVNMNATTIFLTVCSIFFAQTLGIQLSFNQYIILIITSTIGSIGAAGYPSGGVIMLPMILGAIGLPAIDVIPLIFGIDRFMDMFKTASNITGDCVITVIVDKLNNTIDMDIYNS